MVIASATGIVKFVSNIIIPGGGFIVDAFKVAKMILDAAKSVFDLIFAII